MTGIVERAQRIVERLEARDAAGTADLFSARIRGYIERGWSVANYIDEAWHDGLADLAGEPRRISDLSAVSRTAVRLTLDGPRGSAVVTVSFPDEDGGVGGLGIERDAYEGIGTIVIACPDDRVHQMRGFYAALLGDDRWRRPRLGFDEGDGWRPPVWGDPERPQQMHLDLVAADPDAVRDLAIAHGAALVEESGGHRVFADPIGHAFCVRASPSAPAPGALSAVVIDCFSPRALAPFYESLLAMPRRTLDTPDRVEIEAADHGVPRLAFQRMDPYIAPRWPDPAYPAQMHFDLKFSDRDAATELAQRLGAIRLPPGGSCPVYADPAGHPFCLCMHGQ